MPLSGEGLERYRRARHIDYALDVPHEPPVVRPTVALPELLLFGGVDTPPHTALTADAKPLEGLGRLPPRLPSVSSLLLFNTDHTPYEQYMTLDNLLGQDRSGETRETNAELFAAPRTVAEGDTLPEAAMLDYTYAPELEELPAMSLPSALPNLPGVADIQWAGAQDDVLAPSGSKRGGDRAWADGPRPAPAANPTAATAGATGAAAGAGAAAPAAAPASAATTAAAPAAASAPVSAAGAPPPPPPPMAKPPPPPPAPKSAPAAFSGASDNADDDDNAGGGGGGGGAEPGDGGRGDLLASIRAGRKLKKVAERKKVEEEEDKTPAKHGGGATGDIMSDLMSALSRRRQGIASKAVAKQESLPNIGRVVPPPKQAPKNEHLPEHDDEEWSDQ